MHPIAQTPSRVPSRVPSQALFPVPSPSPSRTTPRTTLRTALRRRPARIRPTTAFSVLPLAFASVLLLAACDGGPAEVSPDPDPTPDPEVEVQVVELATGLAHPWGLAFLPGGDMLITERPGQVRLVRDGELRSAPVEGGPSVAAVGQGGLLDIALHPQFDENGWIYLSYARAVQGGLTTAVARAQWEGDALVGLEEIFVADAVTSGGQHFGSRLVFDGEGYLYVTVGERGLQAPAQDLSNHVGTTVRLNDDGSVPGDNPFVGEGDARSEIYSYGHRNPQGMAVHPTTGEIWQTEHGPQGGDELNRIEAGGNYGWPIYNFGNHYNGQPIENPGPESGTVLPVHHWTPAIAPSGLTFYTGDRFPDWQGDAFLGSLTGRHIRRVVLSGNEVVGQESLMANQGHRVRAVVNGPDGYLYFLTDSSNGVLGRLEPGE